MIKMERPEGGCVNSLVLKPKLVFWLLTFFFFSLLTFLLSCHLWTKGGSKWEWSEKYSFKVNLKLIGHSTTVDELVRDSEAQRTTFLEEMTMGGWGES